MLSFVSQHPKHQFSEKNVIYISTFEDVQARVQFKQKQQQQWVRVNKEYNITAGSVRVISLPGSLRTGASTGKETKGIRITATKPVSVQGLVELTDTGEGFLGLPVDALGKYYIIPTFFPVISAVVQVVAKEDNTQVSFKLRLPSNGRVFHGDAVYTNGDVIRVTINDLEVFQVLGDSDLSGTTVTSSKPIAVFSGNDCAFVPSIRPPCNHLVEQIPPVSVWGTRFFTIPTPNRVEGDVFQVIASAGNTDVQVDGHSQKVLNTGDKYETEANKSLDIQTSSPSLVVQYSSGDGSNTRPSMNIVPPVEWVSNDYTIYVDGSNSASDGYMNVVIDTRWRGGLRVKGPIDSVPMNWKLLHGGYSRTSLHLSAAGIYHVYHDSPLLNFTAVMYGMTSKKMFSFPAGLRWEIKGPSCSKTPTKGGDKVDNDCDGITDEELANGKDDDGDGEIDEDLVTPVPSVIMPKDFATPPLLSCGPSSNVANPRQPGFYPTSGPNSAQGVCYVRAKSPMYRISYKDTPGIFPDCQHKFDRVWTVEDSCQNVVKHHQRIIIITPSDPKLTFPVDITLFCRDKKYLEPEFTGEVLKDGNICSRNVTITHKDTGYSGDCSTKEAKLERVWMVEDKCRKPIIKTQVITLVPIGK